MKTKYLLTLIAKHNVDGSYQYANDIMQTEGTNGHVRSHTFASETELVQMVNAVMPNGGTINNRLERLQTEGRYTIECVPSIEMTDEQAVKFGWIPAHSAPEI